MSTTEEVPNPLDLITILVEGASDDLVEVEGCKGADEFTYPSEGPWRGDLIAPNGESMRLHVFLGEETWHVALGQVAEGVPFPNWAFAYENTEKLYSVRVHIRAPRGTRLTNVGKAEIQ